MMIDEALGRGLNRGRTVLKNLPDECTIEAFVLLAFLNDSSSGKKKTLILCQMYFML